ncbi:helix-turn-helix transcriptional regulator [Chitinimonas naiadis]
MIAPKVLNRLDAWGKAVTKRRRQMRLSQAELAARVGVTHQTIGRLELGDPTVRIATYLVTFQVLDLLGVLVPIPDDSLIDLEGGPQRVRSKLGEFDDEYF